MDTDGHRSVVRARGSRSTAEALGPEHPCSSVLIRGSKGLGSARGTVILVSLCFVAVLGIMLAGYLALCSRVMTLSNRGFQTDLSKQLAEAGIEEALRAFNKNDWSDWTASSMDVDWTLDTTNKRATATISYPSGKFGQGVTAQVKVRVDNYDATMIGSTWSSTKTYRIGDLVGYNGIWYRSLRSSNTNVAPSSSDLTWWAPNPMPWKWRTSAPYSQYEMVNDNGIWYRCISGHTSNASTFSSDSWAWTAIPTQRVWASSTAYSVHDVVAYTNPTTGDVGLYRCTTAHTSSGSFSSDSSNWSSDVKTVSLSWTSGSVYTRGAMVYYVGASVYRWYYCIQSGTSSTAPSLDTSMWAPVWSDYYGNSGTTLDTLLAGTVYYVGDYAYYSGNWYRCTTSHTYNNWSSDGIKWTSTNALPYLSLIYRGSTASNLIIYYMGSTWYRYMGGWYVALTGNMHLWTSGYKYNIGDAVFYSTTNRWYRCILAHTASGTITPASTTYWATTPLLSKDWSTDKNYSQYDLVRSKGVWYLCISAHTSSSSIAPTNASYWIGADTTSSSYRWNSTTAYSAGAYRCYGGVWYKCLVANTGQSPNNTTYWTATWSQSNGVATGAPVVYAQSIVTLGDRTSSTTQLRAQLDIAPLFPNAVAANSSTVTSSSGGTVDSYDSTAGTYASQAGTTTNYAAVIASAYTAGTAITLSSTDVKGYVAAPPSSSSPYAPLFSSGGTVKGYNSSPSPSIDLTHVSRSPYIPKFDTIPGGAGGLTTNWSTTPKGTPLSLSYTTNIGTPGDTVPSRYYYNGNLTVGTGTINVLRVNGPVILYINGNLNITASGSTGRIEVTSAGSAEIHVAGTFRADSAGDGILSYNTDPKSLIIISDTTSSNSHYYSEGVNPLYGVVYVPYSTSNSGFYNDNNSTHIYGAVSANKVTYSGADMNVHYDTSLRFATFGGVDQPYTVTQWSELDATEQATMP